MFSTIYVNKDTDLQSRTVRFQSIFLKLSLIEIEIEHTEYILKVKPAG